LIDAFCNKNTGALFDKNGDWAKSGKVDKILLKKLLQDPYFSKKHPKSTGVEYFNLKWLEKYTQDFGTPKDIQATLVELNAMVLKDTLNMHNCNYKENTLYAFGGGVHNTYMIGRMQEVLECKIKTSNDLGINPDFMEAIGFAWLANQTTSKNCSSLPEITGAKKEKILGSVHLA
jgi:anhydro-N-acetylmuramic acid kinase